MRPELNNVLHSLSLNGYSILSLISDILSHVSIWKDRRITCLLEGVERDAVDICARLLNHNTTSSSVFTWVLGVALQSQTRNEHSPNFMTGHSLSLSNGDVISPGLSLGTTSTPANPLEKLLNIGRTHCTCSNFGGIPQRVLTQSYVHSRQIQPYCSNRPASGRCLPGSIRLMSTRPYRVSGSTYEEMDNTSACLPEMAKNHIFVTTPS